MSSWVSKFCWSGFMQQVQQFPPALWLLNFRVQKLVRAEVLLLGNCKLVISISSPRRNRNMIKQIKMYSYQAAVQQGWYLADETSASMPPTVLCPLSSRPYSASPGTCVGSGGARGARQTYDQFCWPLKTPLTTLPSASLAAGQLVMCDGQNTVESINSLTHSQRLHSYLFETFRFARFAQCANQSRFILIFPGWFCFFGFLYHNSCWVFTCSCISSFRYIMCCNPLFFSS